MQARPKARKPNDSFRTPTYFLGGSDCLFTRQGGFILQVLKWFYLVRKINNKIMGLSSALRAVTHNSQAAILKVLRTYIGTTSGFAKEHHTLNEYPLHFISSASRLADTSL